MKITNLQIGQLRGDLIHLYDEHIWVRTQGIPSPDSLINIFWSGEPSDPPKHAEFGLSACHNSPHVIVPRDKLVGSP